MYVLNVLVYCQCGFAGLSSSVCLLASSSTSSSSLYVPVPYGRDEERLLTLCLLASEHSRKISKGRKEKK